MDGMELGLELELSLKLDVFVADGRSSRNGSGCVAIVRYFYLKLGKKVQCQGHEHL